MDDEDFEELSAYRWHASGTNYLYAYRNIRKGSGYRPVGMHRVILGLAGASRKIYVDHINGDTLDNRRANLRICNNRLNQANSKPQRGTSGFRGVRWHKGGRAWVAQIKVDGASMYLGIFRDEKGAARAYDKAAARYFGEFARLNNPK